MAPSPEVSTQIGKLESELVRHSRGTQAKARLNHRVALGLMLLALACSVAAGVLGVFFEKSSKLVGGLAILPPLIAFVGTNMKFEGKSSWHYRKTNALEALRLRLLYQLPDPPKSADVGSIAKEYSELNERMQREWDDTLNFNWSGISKGASNGALSPRQEIPHPSARVKGPHPPDAKREG